MSDSGYASHNRSCDLLVQIDVNMVFQWAPLAKTLFLCGCCCFWFAICVFCFWREILVLAGGTRVALSSFVIMLFFARVLRLMRLGLCHAARGAKKHQLLVAQQQVKQKAIVRVLVELIVTICQVVITSCNKLFVTEFHSS